jgi:hypothetical protein
MCEASRAAKLTKWSLHCRKAVARCGRNSSVVVDDAPAGGATCSSGKAIQVPPIIARFNGLTEPDAQSEDAEKAVVFSYSNINIWLLPFVHS